MLKDIPVINHLFTTGATRAYKVARGDSLERIARKQLGSADAVEQILSLNPELDPRQLRVGQEIRLPVAKDPVIASATGGGVADLFGAMSVSHTVPVGAAGQDPTTGQTTPSATGAPPQAPSGGHSLTDLLNVVTRTIELRGDLELAQAEWETTKQHADQGVVDTRTLRVAEIKLRTLKRQVEVADQLLHGELAAARSHLETLESLKAAGRLSAADPQLSELRNFVNVLSGAL